MMESWGQVMELEERELLASRLMAAREHLARYPGHPLAVLGVARVLKDLARYDEALVLLDELVERMPVEKKGLAMVLGVRGEALEGKGDFEAAAHSYERASAVAPGETLWLIYGGAMHARLGRLDEAEELHRAATRCDATLPRNSVDEAWLNLGFVLRAQERFEEARACFVEALRLEPEYAEAAKALEDMDSVL